MKLILLLLIGTGAITASSSFHYYHTAVVNNNNSISKNKLNSSSSSSINHRHRHSNQSLKLLRGGSSSPDEGNNNGNNDLLSPPPASKTVQQQQEQQQVVNNSFLEQQPPGGDDDDVVMSSSFTPDMTAATNNAVSQQQQTSHHLLGGPAPGFIRRMLPFVPWHKLPNWLTYARCAAIPLLVVMFTNQEKYNHVATSVLFAGASFTDWLDGYLARRWEITSSFGAFLDPVADKLMVSTALILLAGRYGMPIAIPSAIILAREIAVSALREWMAQRGLRDSVQVGFQGKVKTALTMVCLTLLLAVPYPGNDKTTLMFTAGLYSLIACTVITVTSGSVYFKAAAPVLLDSIHNTDAANE